jgi:integrase
MRLLQRCRLRQASRATPAMAAIGYDRETMEAMGFRGGTPYSLRHSFASLLLAGGRQPGYVARQLGHSTAILFEHYEHLISELGPQVIDPEQAIREARGRARLRLAE